jgi:hypothetical protein
LFRKAFHVGDDGFLGRTRYFSTVDLATSMPSLRSSPTIRGEPQLILASDILRINALISSGTRHRPGHDHCTSQFGQQRTFSTMKNGDPKAAAIVLNT